MNYTLTNGIWMDDKEAAIRCFLWRFFETESVIIASILFQITLLSTLLAILDYPSLIQYPLPVAFLYILFHILHQFHVLLTFFWLGFLILVITHRLLCKHINLHTRASNWLALCHFLILTYLILFPFRTWVVYVFTCLVTFSSLSLDDYEGITKRLLPVFL